MTKKTFLLLGFTHLLVTPSYSAVTIATDTTTSLAGSFTFDLVNESSGVGHTIANFPHFHLDIDTPGYTIGDGQFFVMEDSGGGAPTITLSGQDATFIAVQTAPEAYVVGAQPPSYPDRNGVVTSTFDGSTQISFSYTNVGFTSLNVLSGDFSFTVVPEPTSLSLALAGAMLFMRRRRL